MNQPKEKRKSKLTKLIEKYTDRLNTMKENRANDGDRMNDDEMRDADRQISDCAEFVRDLKTLKRKK